MNTLASILFAANAEAAQPTPLDAGAIVHYCEVSKDEKTGKAELDFGEVFALMNKFGPTIQDAIDVSPDELSAGRKERAKETLARALLKLSPDEIRNLGVQIKTLTETEPDKITAENFITADYILKDLNAKNDTLNTLVSPGIDSNSLIIRRVDVTEESLQKRDIESAFAELKTRGITCPPDVISYVVDKEMFPGLTPEGKNSIDFDAFVKQIHPDLVLSVPTEASKAKKPEEQVDLNVLFARKLKQILGLYANLQVNAPKAIVQYSAYIDSNTL